jgi:beta-N-acetylhexosaminidase
MSGTFGPLLFDLLGPELTATEANVLQHPVVGGVVLFARNYVSQEQLIKLTTDINLLRPGLPICVDQEGGRVQRFVAGFPQIPALREFGNAYIASNEPLLESYYSDFRVAMNALHSCRVNVNFAPVIDMQTNPDSFLFTRSIADDAQVVCAVATKLLEIMSQSGVAATLKHFPCHGSVAQDSHYDLPVDQRSEAEIMQDIELYRTLLPLSASVMPAHVVYPKIDPQYPASLSKVFLQDILRTELAYDGVIVSDDLSMGALAQYGSIEDRSLQALAAGCDYLCVCNNQVTSIKLIDSLHASSVLTRESKLNSARRREAFRSSCV